MRKVNKKHLAIVILIVVSILLLIATPYFNELANQTRAVNGYGGECLAWLIPLLSVLFLIDDKGVVSK